ncbi:MAG: class II aldolase/adducin family protein [Granulosicoccus sp.]
MIQDSAGEISHNPEFQALQQYSADVGSNSSLVQGAGGNTSIKINGVMWIKASGTWLMNAREAHQFVPVEIDPLLQAVSDNDPRAEKSIDFVVQSLNPSGLRPSIETTVHALLPHKVVVHVHCVKTISLAVQAQGEQHLNDLLTDFAWSWIPYVRPGLTLANCIQQHMKAGSNVLVLGNHGLVVAADTVDAASLLLDDIINALSVAPRTAPQPDHDKLKHCMTDSQYRLPIHSQAHAVACDETALSIAAGGSLYPDHVIFIGAGSTIAQDNETASEVSKRYVKNGLKEPVCILFPGSGVLIRDDANPGQEAMAACLADVCLHIKPDAEINYFTDRQNDELLNWEAETYRQKLDSQR